MEENKFRCHFSIVIENLGSAFWVILLCFLGQIDNVEMIKDIQDVKDGLLVFGILFGVLALIFVYHCVVWAKTWIAIEDEAIVIEKRLMNRNVNTIGMKNISNINIEQNLFERLVGTCKIKLDTNTRTTAESTDVKIVLSKEKAEQFKQQVMLRMNEDYEAVDDNAEEYDVEYKAKDIVMHCVYTASPFAVLCIIAVITAFIIGIQSMNTGTFFVDSVINILGSLVAILFLIGSTVQSLVKDFFVYYGFKARRYENKIYLSHGFFKKRHYTLAVDKINAVEIVSTTFSRILKRQYVKVICIGVGDEENENSMLLLSETTQSMQQKLSVLLPEFVLEQPEVLKREKQSLWSEIPGAIVLYGVVLAAAILIGGINILDLTEMWIRVLIIIVCGLIIVYHMVSVYLSFQTCGLGIGQSVLLVESGSFEKVSTWIPYYKIQQLQYTQGPVCRHFGMATGCIFILANVLNSIHTTSYFKLEVFEMIHKKILTRKAKMQ